MALELNLSTADQRQYQADLRCFYVAAERHIIPRHLGEPKEAAEGCYAKARELAKSRSVHQKRRARVWVSWVQKGLQKNGHEWGNSPGVKSPMAVVRGLAKAKALD